MNANVTLFTDVFKAILLVKSTAPETAMTLNSYLRKIHRLENDTRKPYSASKTDILKLLDPPSYFSGSPDPGAIQYKAMKVVL